MFNDADFLSGQPPPSTSTTDGLISTVSLKEVGASYLHVLATDFFTILSFRFVAYSPDLLAIAGSRPSKGIDRVHF